MEENNKTLINKIDSKIGTMFKELQIYFIRSTTERVHTLQSNKPQPNNNVTRLFQVYDEVTNSVAQSNTNQNNFFQGQAQSETRTTNS